MGFREKYEKEVRKHAYVCDVMNFEGSNLSLVLSEVAEWVKENKVLMVTCVFDADTAKWVVDVMYKK